VQITTVALRKLASLKRRTAKNVCPLVSHTVIRINTDMETSDCVKNEELLHSAKEDKNNLGTVKRRKANWIGHILLRNCLLTTFY
jgi:hypothetical protein